MLKVDLILDGCKHLSRELHAQGIEATPAEILKKVHTESVRGRPRTQEDVIDRMMNYVLAVTTCEIVFRMVAREIAGEHECPKSQ